MTTRTMTASAKIRAKLKHPVVDSDGHLVEITPVLLDYMRQVGGADAPRRYGAQSGVLTSHWSKLSLDQRREQGVSMTPWWVIPTKNTLDRATASLPRLLSERMDEMGLDFCVLYPTAGTVMPDILDDEVRRVAARAMNLYLAELYGPYGDRMTPAACIPMVSPQEAIEELEYAVNTLHMKAAMIGGWTRRKIEKPRPDADNHYYLDTYGPESPYNYDPFWAKCVELGTPPATHSGAIGQGFRRSPWNYMFNHIGHFSTVGEALAKSLFFSGVMKRHPKLNVAFLECGAGWACDVYAGIIGRWHKRNRVAVHNMNPSNLDKAMYMDLLARYGEPKVLPMLEEIRESLDRPSASPDDVDDWSRSGAKSPEDIRDLFVPRFYFGCEADDPMNAWAFNAKVNPYGARLNAILSSDIGHWDVPDMREVLEEAYELVEKEIVGEDDFADFVFGNPVRLYGAMNPNFYKGTRIEKEAAKVIKAANGKAA